MYDFSRVIPEKEVTRNRNTRIKMLSQHLTTVTRYGIINYTGIPDSTSLNAVMHHGQYAGLYPDARMNDRFQSRFLKRQRFKATKFEAARMQRYKEARIRLL